MRDLRNIMAAVIITPLILTTLIGQGGKDYGEFAPPDAYLEGSEHPYYGAENEWSRRMFSQKAADRYYKRQGQRQMLAIIDGDPEKAVELCRARLDANPQDQEALFVLTVAYCQVGKVREAYKTMKRSVALGMPFGRFLAGPRELLEPLATLPAFKKYAAKHPEEILHGPMVGSVTDRSARFWIRTSKEAAISIIAVPSDGGESLASESVRASQEEDYVAKLILTGLKPETTYQYEVFVDGEPASREDQPTFTTYPPTGTSAVISIGFGGGAGYTPQYERMWDVVRGHQLDAFLFLGDNVYIDMPTFPGAFHDYTYYRRQARPEYRRMVGSTPIYSIWDDHDAAMDDVWLGPYVDKPDWKMPLLEHFRLNWINPGHGQSEWPGCWYEFSIGDVDFFMLDGRTYRTNPFDDDPSMLGPAQKAWLFEALTSSEATFKVVASPVPWAPEAKPGSHDTWDGFKAERDEIFTFIRDQGIDGVLLLSADRHRSDAWKIEVEESYPLYEFCSSKLTNIHTHENMDGALFSYNERCSFGQITFNTIDPMKSITYRTVNIDGEVVDTLTITEEQLKHKE